MGHEPVGVDRVAGEAAADLVVHAARGHRPQGVRGHLALVAAQQELEHRGGRELGRAAEAPVGRVVLRAQPRDGGVERPRVHRVGRGLEPRPAAQPLGDAGAAGADVVAALLPGVRHRLEHLAPARHAHALLGREVGAGVEGHLLGREEDVQRPAAGAGHGLAGLHVDRVEVRALLAVELHAHEQLVHQPRGFLVLEGLALHHVAPVAGGIADREQDRPVLLARASQGLLAPGMPVHRVVLVLEEVGRGLVGQAVRHLGRGYPWRRSSPASASRSSSTTSAEARACGSAPRAAASRSGSRTVSAWTRRTPSGVSTIASRRSSDWSRARRTNPAAQDP